MGQTYKQQYADKFVFNKSVSASGIIGNNSYDVSVESKVNIVVSGAGAANEVTIKGRIFKAAFATISTITGDTTGIMLDVSIYDEIQFDCTNYDSQAFTIKASGFIIL